jgi:hypothetical protein
MQGPEEASLDWLEEMQGPEEASLDWLEASLEASQQQVEFPRLDLLDWLGGHQQQQEGEQQAEQASHCGCSAWFASSPRLQGGSWQ